MQVPERAPPLARERDLDRGNVTKLGPVNPKRPWPSPPKAAQIRLLEIPLRALVNEPFKRAPNSRPDPLRLASGRDEHDDDLGAGEHGVTAADLLI